MMHRPFLRRVAWLGLVTLLMAAGAQAGELSTPMLPTPADLLEAVVSSSTGRMASGRLLKLPPSGHVLPAQFTLVTWTRLPPSRKAGILFGLGDPQGDHATLVTDPQGAPCVVLYRGQNIIQIGRAPIGAYNLADGQIHGVAVTIDLASGLARLYVDGAPEFALVTVSAWRPRDLDATFACLPDAVLEAISQGRLAPPFLLGRGLSDFEILKAALSPSSSQDPLARLSPSVAQWMALLPSACTSFRPVDFPYGFTVKVDAPTNLPAGKNSF